MSVAAAIQWMGWRREDAARWLAEEGLILVIDDGERVRRRVLRADLEERYRQVGRVARPARRPAASRQPNQGREASDDMARWPRPIVMGTVRARVLKKRGRRDRPDGPATAGGACVYWEARQSLGGGERATIWAGWATRSAAERAIADAWRDAEAAETPERRARSVATGRLYGAVRPGADIRTVRELLDAWVDEREVMGLVREATIAANRNRCTQVARILGEMHPLEVSTRILRGFVTRRRRDVGAGTVQQDVMVLMAALRWAQETRRLDIVEMPTPPSIDYTPKRRSRAPARRTLRLMFDALRHGIASTDGEARVKACIEVAHGLELQGRIGARTGELHNLRWRDVITGPAGPCLRLDGKTDERDIPIVPATRELLAAIRERMPGGPDERIVTRRTYGGWVSLVDRRLRALPWGNWGVDPVKPNDLRARFSEAVLNSGATLAEFKALTGHTAATAVEHYHSATPAALVARMSQVDISDAMEVRVLPLRGAEAGTATGTAPVTDWNHEE